MRNGGLWRGLFKGGGGLWRTKAAWRGLVEVLIVWRRGDLEEWRAA